MTPPSEPFPFSPSCPPRADGEIPAIPARFRPILATRPACKLVRRAVWDDVVIALSMAIAAGLATSASELRHMSGIPLRRTLRAIERIEARATDKEERP